MFSGDNCCGIALRLWLSHPGMEKLPCLAVVVMCPACLMMRLAHLPLAWCRHWGHHHWGHHHWGHHRRWHHHMWHPLGLVCPLGLLPLDRPLHLQNHKARQVGLRKTSFCPLVVNACVTYWNGHDKKDSTLPETLLLEFASSTNLSSCFDPSVLKGISATSASAAPAGTRDSDSQAA